MRTYVMLLEGSKCLKNTFFVIFNIEENHKLQKSIEKIFFMNMTMSWRETEKKEHGYKMSNLFKKFKVW